MGSSVFLFMAAEPSSVAVMATSAEASYLQAMKQIIVSLADAEEQELREVAGRAAMWNATFQLAEEVEEEEIEVQEQEEDEVAGGVLAATQIAGYAQSLIARLAAIDLWSLNYEELVALYEDTLDEIEDLNGALDDDTLSDDEAEEAEEAIEELMEFAAKVRSLIHETLEALD
jgi:hypothetical protein